MAQFTLSKEPHRLSAPLSRRISEMRSRFDNARTCGAAFEPAEMDALVEEMTDFTRSARQLEDETRRRHVNDDVPPSVEALCELEDAARAARRMLAPRINEPLIDPTGEIAAEIRKAAAALIKAAKIIGPRAVS